jgi:hypothetical protein
MLYSDLRGEKV